MKEKILQDAKMHAESAKERGNVNIKITLKSGETSSLGKIIQTKKQADLFMKMLKSM